MPEVITSEDKGKIEPNGDSYTEVPTPLHDPEEVTENPLKSFNRAGLRSFVKRVSRKSPRGKQMHITDRETLYSEINRISLEKSKAKGK